MNEVQVDLDEDGRIHLSRAGHSANGIYTLETTEALRAFFQAERDEALGRWRDPENPDWICYGRGSSRDTVYVINEYDGLPYMLERDQVAYADSEFSAVAQRYFEAHPKPKSWDTAQPDEIWVLTINGYSAPYLRNWYGTWTNSTSDVSVGDGTITAGRRIWPEPNSSGAGQ